MSNTKTPLKKLPLLVKKLHKAYPVPSSLKENAFNHREMGLEGTTKGGSENWADEQGVQSSKQFIGNLFRNLFKWKWFQRVSNTRDITGVMPKKEKSQILKILEQELGKK